jgi:hypothetical protein
MSDTLEQKLSQANWTSEKNKDSEFNESEMIVFNSILNEIAEMKASNPFYTPQDELRYYDTERKQYLVHTRKKFS